MAIQDHPRFNTLNTWVKSMIETIKDRQNKYFSRRGRYFQGLKTPTITCDGESEKLIAYGLRPEDQAESWSDFAPRSFKENVAFPANVSIGIYESPLGWGYIIKIEIVKAGLGPDVYGNDGIKWVFQTNEGPETRSGVWNEWHIDYEYVEYPDP